VWTTADDLVTVVWMLCLARITRVTTIAPCLTSVALPRLAAASCSASLPAALAAPLASTIGQVYWEDWTGSALVLNLFKCGLASLIFLAVIGGQAACGVRLAALSPRAVHMLLLSSFLGIVVGDLMWLQALQLIGARACIMLGALQPGVAALVGAVYLGQPLGSRLALGLGLTTAGLLLTQSSGVVPGLFGALERAALGLRSSIVDTDAALFQQMAKQREQRDRFPSLPDSAQGSDLVIASQILLALLPSSPPCEHEATAGSEDDYLGEHALPDRGVATIGNAASAQEGDTPTGGAPEGDTSSDRKAVAIIVGTTFAILNMVLDVIGAALTRNYGGGASSFQINAIRFGFASIVTASFVIVRRLASHIQSIRPPAWTSPPELDRAGWVTATRGVVLVTFITPALSNFALFGLPFGVWAALTALGPIYTAPIFWLVRGQKTSLIGLVGAALASVGAAVVSTVVR
jgi:drug/metabolite transporter (DMT)-like permease